MERKDVTVNLGTARAVAGAGLGGTPPTEDSEAGEGSLDASDAPDAAVDYLDEWAGWLQRNGFPYDGFTTEPPPPAVVKRLAEIWLEVEQDPELTVWDYAQGFEEYGWKATSDA